MKPFGLLFLVLFAFAICDDFPIENDVIVLTDDTLDKAVAQYENLLVLFYAPWCGHCKAFKPEFEKASATLQKENLMCAKVDATENKKVADKFAVRGYPTIKFFKKGVAVDYTGGRKENDVITWMRKRVGAPYKTFTTSEEIEKLKEDNEVCVIYFGTDKNDLEQFSIIAMQVDEFPFAVVESKDLIKEYSKAGTAVMFKKFDEKKNEITTIKKEALEDFVKKYSLPRVMTFNEKTADIIFGDSNPAIAIFADSSNEEKFEDYRKLMDGLHEKLTSKNLKLVVSDIKEGMAKRVADYVGVKEKDLPCLRIIDTRDGLKKYVLTEEINKNNIMDFVDDWIGGFLTPYLKSQEVPKENNEDVLVVVGKTFQQEVIDNDNDVLLLFYAPWCGHCKALHPKYEEAARILKKKNPKIVLAKIDATENEIESVKINGFPTLKFYPGNQKDKAPLDYDGDRSTEAIIKFIREKGYNKVDAKKKEAKKEETDL